MGWCAQSPACLPAHPAPFALGKYHQMGCPFTPRTPQSILGVQRSGHTFFFSFLLRPFPCVAQAGSDFMILQLQLLWVSSYRVYSHSHFPGCCPYLTCGCYKCSHLWPQEKTPSSAETAEGTLLLAPNVYLGCQYLPGACSLGKRWPFFSSYLGQCTDVCVSLVLSAFMI